MTPSHGASRTNCTVPVISRMASHGAARSTRRPSVGDAAVVHRCLRARHARGYRASPRRGRPPTRPDRWAVRRPRAARSGVSAELLRGRSPAEHAPDAPEQDARAGDDRQPRPAQPEQPTVLARERRHRPAEQHPVGGTHPPPERRVPDEPHHLIHSLVAAQRAVQSAAPRSGRAARRPSAADPARRPSGRPPPIRRRSRRLRRGSRRPSARGCRGRRRRTPCAPTAAGRRRPPSRAPPCRRQPRYVPRTRSWNLPTRADSARRARRAREGDDDDPADGAGEPAERVLAVARPVVHAGHRARVERLHEQRPDAGDDRRHAAVHGPRGRADAEVAGVVAVLDVEQPLGATVRTAGEHVEQVRPPAASSPTPMLRA